MSARLAATIDWPTLEHEPGIPGPCVYVLVCADGTFYTGYTIDLARRLEQHQSGTASRYTRARLPVSLKGFWRFADRRKAMRAEVAFKRLDRRAKGRMLETTPGHARPL